MVQLLIALSTADLIMMILTRINGSEERIYDVQFVSIGIKILTFVSIFFSRDGHLLPLNYL